jgi:pimeloyl-[acyl-carrier protein] methyl ester esterase
MTLHVVGGWAYATEYLTPLVTALKPHMDVVSHPFHVDMTALPVNASDMWVAGWSLGGLRLLDAVARGELLPRGMILVSSTAKFCTANEYSHGVTTAALRSMIIGIKRNRDKTLLRFFTDALGEGIHDSGINERIKRAEVYDNELLMAGLHQLETMDMRVMLRTIRIPMLILHGRHDAIIPPGASQFVRANVTSGSIQLHPEAGHELPVQYPEWVGDQIASFVAGT